MNDDLICRICGYKSDAIISVSSRRVNDGSSFRYLACNHCGTLQLNETIADLEKYYSKGYAAHFIDPDVKENETDDYLQFCLGIVVRFRFARHIRYLRHRVGKYILFCGTHISRDKSILDVGCGNGEWLYGLLRFGYRKLTGCDLYSKRTYPGIVFRKTDIFGIQNEKFDCITFHHSFEHMSNPHEVLNKARELLSDKGLIIIRIPLWKSKAWDLYGTNWYQIDPPFHFFLYTKESLSYLCIKAGLKVTGIIYDSTPEQFYVSEMYKNTDQSYNEIQSNIDMDKYDSYREMTCEVNKHGLGDQAAFFIVKD